MAWFRSMYTQFLQSHSPLIFPQARPAMYDTKNHDHDWVPESKLVYHKIIFAKFFCSHTGWTCYNLYGWPSLIILDTSSSCFTNDCSAWKVRHSSPLLSDHDFQFFLISTKDVKLCFFSKQNCRLILVRDNPVWWQLRFYVSENAIGDMYSCTVTCILKNVHLNIWLFFYYYYLLI